MSTKGVRILLAVLAGFVALTAIGGGLALLFGAEAGRFPLEWLQGTPFPDYTIPALLLAVVVGGSALLACVLVSMGRKPGPLAGLAAGSILMGYIGVEVLILKQVPPGPTVIEIFYFALGLGMLTLAGSLWLMEKRQALAAG